MSSNKQLKPPKMIKCSYVSCLISAGPVLNCMDYNLKFHEACAVAANCAFVNNAGEPLVIICAKCAKTRTELSFASSRRSAGAEFSYISANNSRLTTSGASDCSQELGSYIQQTIQSTIEATLPSAVAHAIDQHLVAFRREFSADLKAVKESIRKYEDRIGNIEAEIQDISDRVTQCSSDSDLLQNLPVDDIYSELREIDRRANNLILMGLKEAGKGSDQDGSNGDSDKSTVIKLLSPI